MNSEYKSALKRFLNEIQEECTRHQNNQYLNSLLTSFQGKPFEITIRSHEDRCEGRSDGQDNNRNTR